MARWYNGPLPAPLSRCNRKRRAICHRASQAEWQTATRRRSRSWPNHVDCSPSTKRGASRGGTALTRRKNSSNILVPVLTRSPKMRTSFGKRWVWTARNFRNRFRRHHRLSYSQSILFARRTHVWIVIQGMARVGRFFRRLSYIWRGSQSFPRTRKHRNKGGLLDSGPIQNHPR